AQAGDGDGLLVGPLSEDGEGGWWLSLAVRHEPGRWLLARLRTTELARMVEGLDSGPGGHVTILDASGVLLTRAPASRTGPFVGQRAQLPPLLGDGATQGLARGTSPFDGVERARGFSTTSGFDMVVVAGISLDRILAGWHRLAVIAAILSLLYWVGLAYLVRRLGRAEQAHAELVGDLEAQADWLDQAQRAARTGVWRIEADGEHGRVSAHTAMMYGLAPEEAVYPLEEIFRRVHDDDRERVQAEFMRARDTGAPYLSEHRIVLPDGGVRWVTARGGLAGREGRGAARFTEHTAMMYGLAPEEAVYPLEEIFRRVHDDDRERVQAEFMRARDTGAPYLSEHRIVLPDGGVRWVTARGGLAGGEGRGAPRFT